MTQVAPVQAQVVQVQPVRADGAAVQQLQTQGALQGALNGTNISATVEILGTDYAPGTLGDMAKNPLKYDFSTRMAATSRIQAGESLHSPVQQVMAAGGNSANPQVVKVGLGGVSQNWTCQWCGKAGPTKVVERVCTGTHLIAGVTCLFGCSCGCCLIPYCIGATKAKDHYCTACDKMVGVNAFLMD